MKNVEAVLMVKFNSTHSPEELNNGCQEDLETFRNVPGLLQKYYVTEEISGSISGIYIFETKKARTTFWESELAKGIPTRYGIIANTLRIEQYDMAIVLNDAIFS